MRNKRKIITSLMLTILMLFFNIGTKDVKALDNGNYDQLFKSISLSKSYKPINQGNPCMTQRFTADPGVMEYNGRLYVYTTHDQYIYKNGGVAENTYGNIQTINCMSTNDMVNWTDHGIIKVAGSSGAAKWAACSWAPTAAHKMINGKEKFFLYFANSAGGIGVLTSDSPTGPWTDPLGHALVDKRTPNCSNVVWMFDPAVLVDDDGSAYLYFGGGIPKNQAAHPRTARVVKLGSDMTSLASTPKEIDAPYLFEDSGINKIGNTYYYSYCTNWSSRASSNDPPTATIAYMTSNSPTGPFTYKGTFLNNPGTFFGCYGNNHHSIVKFNNKYYVFYHSQWLENKMGTNKGYRSTHVDEVNISNGTINNVKATLTGVPQIRNVDPYVENRMSNMAWQGGIEVSGSGNTVVKMNKGDWTGVSNVDFGSGSKSISIKVASSNGAVIKVCVDDPSKTALGYITVPATGSQYSYKTISSNINISGNKKLFFVASGDCVVDSWQFSKTSGGSTGGGNEDVVKINDGWYYIKNVHAQKYLQVKNNTGKAGQNVELRTGSGSNGQKWYLKNVGNGYFTLQSALGNYMLDVNCASNTDGANIQIYHAYSGNAQQFALKKSSTSGAYIVCTKCSNLSKALDDYNLVKSDGANVCQWTSNGQKNQQWIFEKVSSGGSTGGGSVVDSKLSASYTINNWGSGYQISFKISNNTSSDVNGWTLKLKKSEVNISSSWNVNVKESGDYYVITPVDWNKNISKGSSIEFGIQGIGSIGNSLYYSLS